MHFEKPLGHWANRTAHLAMHLKDPGIFFILLTRFQPRTPRTTAKSQERRFQGVLVLGFWFPGPWVQSFFYSNHKNLAESRKPRIKTPCSWFKPALGSGATLKKCLNEFKTYSSLRPRMPRIRMYELRETDKQSKANQLCAQQIRVSFIVCNHKAT